MIGLECERINVEVNYCLSYPELAARMEASGTVLKAIVEDPRWCVVDPPKTDILNVEMYLYELDHNVIGIMRIHRLLIQNRLRPALLHETVSLCQKAIPGMLSWACLGVLWGPGANLYYRQLKGQCYLYFSGCSLGAKTIIPAVHFSGSWNKLPGMGI